MSTLSSSYPQTRKVGRRALAGTTAIVLVASLMSGGSWAAAAPAGADAKAQLSASERQVIEKQAPYIELDIKVRELAAAAGSPLAGTRIDLQDRVLHVYWAGETPAAVTGLSADAAKLGIALKVSRAAYSEKQLMEASRHLEEFHMSSQTPLEVELHNDGSGLTVSSAGLATAAQGRAVSTKAQADLLNAIQSLRNKISVPIAVKDSDGHMTPASRRDDGRPHWGGAVTAWYRPNGTGSACTSGFSTYATGDPSMRHMLTAAHCSGYLDNQVIYNGAQPRVRMGTTDFIAEMFDQWPRYDLGVIRLDHANSIANAPNVYSNESIADPYKVVGFRQGIPVGEVFCISAAVSTPSCRLRSGGQREVCPGGGVPCWFVIDALSTDGNTIICHGDSGGPIYSWNSDWTGIYAAGIMSTLNVETGCGTRAGLSVVWTAMNRIPGLWVLTH